MNKNDVLKVYQEVLKEHGFECNLLEADELVKALGDTIEKLGEQLECEESCNMGCLKIEKKLRKSRTQKTVLNGVETEWTSPAKELISIKAKKSFENETSKEV